MRTNISRKSLSLSGLGLLCSLLLSGCSSNGTFSLIPTGHFLTGTTQEVLAASPSVARLPRELEKTVLPALYLQPGDAVLLEVVDFTSDVRLPADQQILPDGSIDLGKYGRLIVAGLTPEQAEQLIEERLVETGEEADEQVNLRLLEPQSVYYVLGEVSSPGSYPLVGSETVLDAIVAAGGMTGDASLCDVLLARPTHPGSCRVALPICYRQIAQLGDTSTNYQLQPGDRVYVGTKSMCDSLKFWQTYTSCPKCRCQQQVACPDPSIANYRNPIATLPAQPEPAKGASQLPAPEGVEGLLDPSTPRSLPAGLDFPEAPPTPDVVLPPVVVGLIEK